MALMALGPSPQAPAQAVVPATSVAPPSPTSAQTNSTAGPAPSTAVTITTHVSISKTVIGHDTGEFSGVDLSPTQTLGSTLTHMLKATGITYVRWPSGKLNDQYDPIQNVVHYDNGSSSVGRTNLSAFVAWCRSTHCHAILGIPGETNNSSYAAAEVSYVERVLGFHPTFWEIGNEPGLWQHYNIPWSQWGTSQQSGTSPEGYAQIVHRYLSAIHSIDPLAKVLGLPGTGLGAYDESEWVYDTVKLNGPSLAAVAIHVYPAGHLSGLTGNLSQFDQSLSGKSAIDQRVPLDRAAIRSACPRCHLSLFATEYNAASVGSLNDTGTYGQFMQGSDEVPYMAAVVAQGLSHRVSNMDIFNFESGFPGAMVASNGTARPLYYLYSEIFRHLDKNVVQTTFSESLGEFFGSTTTSGNTSMVLLLANANPTTNIKVDLVGSGILLHQSGTAWIFGPGMAQPKERNWSGSVPLYWTVSAESVLLIDIG
jgi:hypothetical protein